jgi:glucose-6-phosphate 1-dehydrogenase
MTETYAALKLTLKNKIWKDIPIHIRSGKALKQKWTGVVVEFKPRGPQRRGKVAPNRLVIDIQPNERIEFHLLTKLGGKFFDFHPLTTGRPIYCSGDCLSEHGRLLLSALEGKKDLFLGFDEIMASWRVLDPIQKVCTLFGKNHCKPVIYKKGSLGPKDDVDWFNPKLA